LTKSYPASSKKDNLTKKQINYFTKNADFIVGNIPHNESCPKWDILTIACYGLDTEEWKPSYDYNYKKNAQLEPFKILHCPNHRAVKGTDFLIRACEELIKEGYNIDLQVVEKVSLKELQRKMKDCDIVASQFLYGYATNEIEGMSLAKPVLSNLENDYYYLAARRYTHIIECPILSTSPEKIKENIILLFENPELREELGKKGREYVLRYHSLEGQGLMWSKIINQVLTGSGDSLDEWWKERQTMKI
jgi:glycosyltransferase involved in cell wall biosynthesis